MLNWNQQHWTVLKRVGATDHWEHLNSQPGEAMHQGARQLSVTELFELLAHIQNTCGRVSMHIVTEVPSEGAAFLLSTEGMRAMLPSEVVETADDHAHGEDHNASGHLDAGTFSSQIKIITLNVAGLNDFRFQPATRMEHIVQELLPLDPDVLLFQEVTAEMYAALRKNLCGWQVRRMQEAPEDYFLVSAVRAPAAAIACSSYLFRSSVNGRHLLTVRVGPWILVNVHADSGGRAAERDQRAAQLQHMSRLYESDRVMVNKSVALIGDFNARDGEDHILQSEGWVDAWMTQTPAAESWTWHRGMFKARYDRVYTQACAAVEISRHTSLCPKFTDHVALCACLRREGSPASSPTVDGHQASFSSKLPKEAQSQDARPSRRLADDVQPPSAAVASTVSQDNRPSRCNATGSLSQADVSVVTIANTVTRSMQVFHKSVVACYAEPDTVHVDDNEVPSWDSLPSHRGFKRERFRDGRRIRRASDEDRLQQRRGYGKFLLWASQFQMQRPMLDKLILDVPGAQSKRGRQGIPACFHVANATVHEHLVLACRTAALQDLAANAGKAVGGEKMAAAAQTQMADLLQLTYTAYLQKIRAIPGQCLFSSSLS